MEINSAVELKKLVEQDKPVLIDFWAAWCGPCKMVAPVVEKVAETYEGKAVIGKINVDEQAEIASSFKVMSIPTLVFLKDGKEVNRIVGFRPITEIAQALEGLL